MSRLKIMSLSDAMKVTRKKDKSFSIEFVISSGEVISIQHAQRTKLPKNFNKVEKNYICVEDLSKPKQHPFPVFLWAIENINDFKIAV